MAVFGNRRHTAAAVVAFLWPNYETFAMIHHFLPGAFLVFAFAMLFSGSAIAGLQEGLDALRAGEVKPGGRLTGKIVGSRSKTTWNLEFDVTLPAKDAAAGMSCGK